jgi:hypothetical protein
MNRYYLTFGQKYLRDEHPSGWPIHPNKIVEVWAPSWDEARELAIKVFGVHWAFINEWDKDIAAWYYPEPLAVLCADDIELAEKPFEPYTDLKMPYWAMRPLKRRFGLPGTTSWRGGSDWDGSIKGLAALGLDALREVPGVGPRGLAEIENALALRGYVLAGTGRELAARS